MKTPNSRPVHRPYGPDRAALDELAAQALAFLAADPERLGRFFAITGLSPADLRAAAAKPDFVAGLLDYLATDERAFVGFAAEIGREPAALDKLRLALSPPAPEV